MANAPLRLPPPWSTYLKQHRCERVPNIHQPPRLNRIRGMPYAQGTLQSRHSAHKKGIGRWIGEQAVSPGSVVEHPQHGDNAVGGAVGAADVTAGGTDAVRRQTNTTWTHTTEVGKVSSSRLQRGTCSAHVRHSSAYHKANAWGGRRL